MKGSYKYELGGAQVVRIQSTTHRLNLDLLGFYDDTILDLCRSKLDLIVNNFFSDCILEMQTIERGHRAR